MDTQYLRAPGAGENLALGDLELPGVVTSIEVRGQYEIEKKKVAGLSGTNKLGHGYNDAQVTVNLEILPPDENGQVKQIEAVFKAAFGEGGKPKPIRCVNPLLDSRDVTSVLFAGFTVRQGNEGEGLLCQLELLEFEPLARKNELKQKQKVVTGPNALPIPAVSATYTPPKATIGDFFGAGVSHGVALGEGKAPPLMPILRDIIAGGPMTEAFINNPDGLK